MRNISLVSMAGGWLHMSENVSESFNRMSWHDSKFRSLRILRKDDLDEVLLDVELRDMPGQELTPMTIVLEDAVFFFGDIDLQGKRECSDDISSAKCQAKSDLMTKLQNERLKHSPDALAGYFHFSIYLIPPGGTVDVIASGFRLEGQAKESGRR
jgi:hypothetical protein